MGNKKSFIRVSDKDTIEQLKIAGFQVISENSSYTTFLNSGSCFSDEVDLGKVKYTDMYCM